MATVYIAEFRTTAMIGTQGAPLGSGPPLAEQTVAIGGSSAASSAFNANTHMIRVSTDAICSIAFGAAPVATTSNMRMAANQTEYFAVIPGQKLAVITNT